MKDGGCGGFEQSYNSQIAVDDEAQIIVASTLTLVRPRQTAVGAGIGKSQNKYGPAAR